MLQREHYDNRTDWLAARKNKIGGSDAAAVLGLSSFATNLDVFNIKTGRMPAPDLSNNPSVQFGTNAEEPLRMLFALKNPQYEVRHYPYDILYQSELPFISATLDGELIEKATGRIGVLEVKTADISKRAQREKWNNQIPQHYYVQVCHQLASTKYDFVIVFALLTDKDGDCLLRTYSFYRSEMQDDIDYVVSQETEFWNKHILTDTPPALILPPLSLIA